MYSDVRVIQNAPAVNWISLTIPQIWHRLTVYVSRFSNHDGWSGRVTHIIVRTNIRNSRQVAVLVQSDR